MICEIKVGYQLIHQFETGGKIWCHELVDKSMRDYLDIFDVALDKAMDGCEVLILPILKEGDHRRTIIFDGAFQNKCPDIKIDHQFVEIKTPLLPLHDAKISQSIKLGREQANYVIVALLERYSTGRLYKIAKGRFKTHTSLKTIEFKMGGKYYRFDRNKILKHYI